jgi:hypothetical protein
MARQIIQISVAAVVLGDIGHTVLYALCDDGTTWSLVYGEDWKRVRPVPQEPTKEGEDGHAA